MDRLEFEKDLMNLLKKHKFAFENVTKVSVDIEAGGMFLVNVEVQAY